MRRRWVPCGLRSPFLLEEGFDAAKAEVVELLESIRTDVPEFDYELRDLMIVQPTQTPEDSPVVLAIDRAPLLDLTQTD
jgi:succinyl-diaminopimelate desuccinylase